ncbi:MAG TPA: hypothetical protein VJS89_04005 [Gammaproteobacteria bacterium]|nr:hypothetical protein [Gammaproteobacteria bacterium]
MASVFGIDEVKLAAEFEQVARQRRAYGSRRGARPDQRHTMWAQQKFQITHTHARSIPLYLPRHSGFRFIPLSAKDVIAAELRFGPACETIAVECMKIDHRIVNRRRRQSLGFGGGVGHLQAPPLAESACVLDTVAAIDISRVGVVQTLAEAVLVVLAHGLKFIGMPAGFDIGTTGSQRQHDQQY